MDYNQHNANLDAYLDANLEDRTRDKMQSLPDFYKSTDGVMRYTNMEDAVDGIKQQYWISIARAIREGDRALAGDILAAALVNVCRSQAEEELEEEFEAGKSAIDYAADRADYLRQIQRDAGIDG